ncbi:MAG TPA: HD domain-containing phosphohydrolase [Treponemataceae bacterium]|nr:HD domain-containing phosphohydrolase [Treponemataceae bacterium]
MHNNPYTTKFPIRTPQGVEILPAGVTLHQATINDLQNLKSNRTFDEYGYNKKIQKDMEFIFDKPHYDIIFRDKNTRTSVLDKLTFVSYPHCLIEVVEWFKEYDKYTYNHFLSVYALSTHIFSLLYPQSKEPLGSLFHDIGKCSLPLTILKKETPLTVKEKEYIKHHTLAGYALVNFFYGKTTSNYADIIARDHHENKNATGYPAGVCLNDIKTEIIIACDIYDALLSQRAYRKEAFDNRTALEELTMQAMDGVISKEIVQVLIACNRKNENSWKKCKVSNDIRGVVPEHNSYGITANEKT